MSPVEAAKPTPHHGPWLAQLQPSTISLPSCPPPALAGAASSLTSIWCTIIGRLAAEHAREGRHGRAGVGGQAVQGLVAACSKPKVHSKRRTTHEFPMSERHERHERHAFTLDTTPPLARHPGTTATPGQPVGCQQPLPGPSHPTWIQHPPKSMMGFGTVRVRGRSRVPYLPAGEETSEGWRRQAGRRRQVAAQQPTAA